MLFSKQAGLAQKIDLCFIVFSYQIS